MHCETSEDERYVCREYGRRIYLKDKAEMVSKPTSAVVKFLNVQ